MILNKLFVFITRFKDGYTFFDKIKIFFHNVLYIILYPINTISFLLSRRHLLHPRVFFSGFVIKNSDGTFYCRDNVDMDIVSERFESDLRRYFKGFKRGTFIDVGSNIGKYTVMIGRGGKVKVVSIEPEKDNFRALKKNLDLNNCRNVLAVNMAAWKERGEIKLFEHEGQGVLASATKPSETYTTVRADSIDNIINDNNISDVDFVKIDVEGAEPEVLKGMKNILSAGNTKIIFEAWDEEHFRKCMKILDKYRYVAKRIGKIYWFATKPRTR
ncbi:MAG: FkbM family methyltransferase [Candidatus Aenigmarchaeota archaeon]|nr:FkbM family methyltransferase [Candidatus Aenigmarchaeota archaeon]